MGEANPAPEFAGTEFAGTQWESLEPASRAARRVNQALATLHIGDEELAWAAKQLELVADALESAPPRSKLDDLLSRPYISEIYQGQYAPIPVDVGDAIEFDPFSMGGGALHPASIGLSYTKESDEAVTATTVVHPMFAGPPERTHGGALALLFDEVMGGLNRMRGTQAFTAWLRVDYRGPTPLDERLFFRAWIHSTEGRKIVVRATCHTHSGEGASEDGAGENGAGDERVLTADCEGLFVMPRPEGA